MQKVYFITDGYNVKIGHTHGKVIDRLRQLQTGSASQLYCLGFIFGSIELEKELHKKFGHLKVRNSNKEWFVPDDNLLDYLNKNNQSNVFVDYRNRKLYAYNKLDRIVSENRKK